MDRYTVLNMTDEELLKLCKVDFFKATGPGGQKKNKTESAVRITYVDQSISGDPPPSHWHFIKCVIPEPKLVQ